MWSSVWLEFYRRQRVAAKGMDHNTQGSLQTVSRMLRARHDLWGLQSRPVSPFYQCVSRFAGEISLKLEPLKEKDLRAREALPTSVKQSKYNFIVHSVRTTRHRI